MSALLPMKATREVHLRRRLGSQPSAMPFGTVAAPGPISAIVPAYLLLALRKQPTQPLHQCSGDLLSRCLATEDGIFLSIACAFVGCLRDRAII